jgi:hypothetical protein
MRNIFLKENGDLHIEDNEIYICGESDHEAFKNTLLHRLQTRSEDWKLNNSELVEFYGLDISDFMGDRLSNRLIGAIKYLIMSMLTEDGLLNTEDIAIFNLPINYNTLILKISITKNDFIDKPIAIDITYDLRSNRIIPKIVNVPEGEIWQS